MERLSQKDRAIGAFIGLAVGDALGTTLKFRPRDSYPPLTDMIGGGVFNLMPGEWTDDTAMALCLADSLIAYNGKLNKRDLLRRFVRWWREGENSCTGVCFDIGNQTASALAAFEQTGRLFHNIEKAKHGNGSLKRIAPVVICNRSGLGAEIMADEQSKTTHFAEAARFECGNLANILHGLIEDDGIYETIWAIGDREIPRNRIRSTGHVRDTRLAAHWSVVTTGNFRDAVLTAANLGDDADTVAAVAGQIAGAKYGLAAIPLAWRKRLAWSERLHDTAEKLWALRRQSSEFRIDELALLERGTAGL